MNYYYNLYTIVLYETIVFNFVASINIYIYIYTYIYIYIHIYIYIYIYIYYNIFKLRVNYYEFRIPLKLYICSYSFEFYNFN